MRYTSAMKHLFLAFFLLVPSLSFAANPYLQCEFSKRYSGEYENVNDFTFEEYPWLMISAKGEGWEVTVGGITYGEEDPGTIVKKSVGDGQMQFASAADRWTLTIDVRRKMALFAAAVDEAAPSENVALFRCQ